MCFVRWRLSPELGHTQTRHDSHSTALFFTLTTTHRHRPLGPSGEPHFTIPGLTRHTVLSLPAFSPLHKSPIPSRQS